MTVSDMGITAADMEIGLRSVKYNSGKASSYIIVKRSDV
jgi:hypothetical protein